LEIFSQDSIDVLFKNATIIDGSNSPATVKDVAIIGNQIELEPTLPVKDSTRVIDAKGLILAPGFIDVHTHDDIEVIRNPEMLSKISQGVTSVIVGNCGISASPVKLNQPPPDPLNLLGEQQDFKFTHFSDYVNAVTAARPAVNVAALVGHTALRLQVMDRLDRAASLLEINTMRKALKLALEQGAKGLSSGLAYSSASSAPGSELQSLAKEMKAFDAVYATHLRTEFDGILDAMTEAFELGSSANVSVVISHLKCAGKLNWGRSSEILKHLKSAQKSQTVACDCYPYSASSSTLDLLQVTEDFEIFITWSEFYPQMAGKTLSHISQQWNISLMDAAKKLQPAGAVYHCMDDNDVENILQFSDSMIGSDGLPCDPHPHPRLWGTFPRVLGHYSRDKKLFKLEQAIHKMTGLSADKFKLNKRGYIRSGYYADLVLFNPLTIKDRSDYVNPIATAQGIEQVWVNGKLSYEPSNKSLIPAKAGLFLKHKEEIIND